LSNLLHTRPQSLPNLKALYLSPGQNGANDLHKLQQQFKYELDIRIVNHWLIRECWRELVFEKKPFIREVQPMTIWKGGRYQRDLSKPDPLLDLEIASDFATDIESDDNR
jgi:hypothetical protein